MTPRVRQYVAEEAKFAGISTRDLLSRDRRHHVAYARRRVAVRLRNDGFTYPQIAGWLGLKSHTTVVYYMQGKARHRDVAA